MSERLKHLYEALILDHNKNPRNFKILDGASHSCHGINPLCGDDYHIYLNINNGVLEDIGFSGNGCAISRSSGSLLTSMLKGKTTDEALSLKDSFLKMLLTDQGVSENELGKLKVFEGVKKFPIRVKCATLIWRALEKAITDGEGGISTE